MGDHVGRADATRERMLAAGRTLLPEVATVDDLTVRMICRAADGSASSFYRIFESREQYLLSLHSELIERLLTAAAREFDAPFPSDESAEVWLRRGVVNAVEAVGQHLWFVSRLAPLVRRDRQHAALRTRLDTAIVNGLDAGIIKRFDDGSEEVRTRSRVVAWTLWITAVRGHSGRVPFLGEVGASRDTAVAQLSSMVVRYLRSPVERSGFRPVRIPEIPERVSGTGVRAQVLDAMERLLEGRDAMELTTLDVAIAADLAQGSIYDEFGSKVDVIVAVLDRMLAEIFETIDVVVNAARPEQADRPADLVLFMAQAYSILAAFMDERYHLLGAFEAPRRIAPAVADALAINEERLIDHAAALLPQWVVDEGDVHAGIFAARVGKLVLQATYWGDPPFGDVLGLSTGELVLELAVMSAGAIDASAKRS